MLRTLTLATALACTPMIAAADSHLAGGKMPSVTSFAAGDCRTEMTTETVQGVRVHRMRSVGCEAAQAPRAAQPTAQTSQSVTVNTRVIFQAERRGTSPYVLGSPSHMRARSRHSYRVLGAPGSR